MFVSPLKFEAEKKKFKAAVNYSPTSVVCVYPLQTPLCHYEEVVFRQGAHRRLVEEVQAELKAISDDIAERNSQLELPYPYLCPGHIENSVAI